MIIAEEYVTKFYGDDTQYDATVNRMRDSLGRFVGATEKTNAAVELNFQSIGRSVSLAGAEITKILAPFSALGALAIASSQDINTAFREIRVGTGATGDALGVLKKDFENVFSTVPASARDAGLAIAELNQLTGATGATLEGLATQQLNLARITGSELKPQIEATTKAFNNWKIAAADQGTELDSLFKVSQLTGVSVTNLASQVTAGGAAARIAGLSFDQTALLVGQLSKAGLDGTSILQGFSMAFRRIAQKDANADPSAVLQDVIKRIGEAGTAAQVNKIAIDAFGRGGIAMGEAIKSGRLNLEDLTKAFSASHDTINKASDDTRTFGESMTLLKNQVELALAPLGRDMTGILKSFQPDMQAVINLIKQMSDAFVALPQGTRAAIAGLVLLAGAIGPLTIAIGGMIAVMGGPLTLALTALGAVATVMALDYVEGAGKAGASTVSLQSQMIELAKIIGMVMDIIGALAHIVMGFFDITIGEIISVVTAAKRAISGDFAGALDALGEGSRQAALDFNAAWDEVNGKWTARLQGMVGAAYSAVAGFGGAGKASAAAYNAGLANMGIGLGAKAPFDKGAKADTSPAGFAAAMGEPVGKAAEAAGTGAAGKFLNSFSKGLKGGGAGGGLGKALVDAYQDGIPGLTAAIAKLDSSDLSGLFDRLSKKAKAGSEDIKNALKAVVAAVNDFATSHGVAAKITEAQFANMSESTRKSLEQETLAYRTAKDEIQRVQVEGLAGQKVIFAATQAEIDKMSDAVKKKFADLGGAFLIMPPDLQKLGHTVMQVAGDIGNAVSDMAKESQAGFDAFLAATTKTMGEAPKPFADASIKILEFGKKLKEALAGDETIAVIDAQADIRNTIESTIKKIEEWGVTLGKSGNDLDKFVLDTISRMKGFKDANEGDISAIIEVHKKAAIQLPGIWGPVFDRLGSQAKSWAGALFGVLDTIPGAFGSAVKKTTDTISQWAAFFDKILGFLHKFVDAVPDSIGSALSQVLGLIKQTQNAITSLPVAANKPGYLDPLGMIPDLTNAASGAAKATGGISSAISKMSDGAKAGFAAAAGAAAAFGTALAMTAAGGSKSMVLLTGAIQSAITGFMVSVATTGPIGAIVGGISFLGTILGTLFGGKSAAQKQKEALQLQQLKDQVALDAQNIVSAAMDSFNKALDFLDRLDDFTPARRKAFTRFFAQLTLLMDYFVELAKVWGKDSLDKAKALADTIGPVADAIGGALSALDGMNNFIAPAASIVDEFFASLTAVITKFGELAETVPNSLAKHARKFAEKIKDVVDVIGGAVIAFLGDGKDAPGLIDIKDIPAEAFDALKAGLLMAVTKIGELAETIDAGMVKQASRFAQRVEVVAVLLKDAVTGLADVGKLTAIPAEAFQIFHDGIKGALEMMIQIADEVETGLLGRAVIIATAMAPIADALKSWADASAAVSGYVAIGAEIWGQMNLDFENTLLTIDSWMALALKYVDKTAAFKDAMTAIAENLVAGLKVYSDGMKASSALISTIPMPTPITPSSFGAQSFVRQSAGGSSVSIGTMPVTINLPPGATDGDGDIARRIFAEEIVKWMRDFRLVQSTA